MTDASNHRDQYDVGWTCPACKLQRGPNYHETCIPNLPGVRYACCGHGQTGDCQGYLYFENGVRLGIVVTSVDYDDGRRAIRFEGPCTVPVVDGVGNIRPLTLIVIDAIRFALTRLHGDASKTARQLQIGRSTLYRKLDEAGVSTEPYRR